FSWGTPPRARGSIAPPAPTPRRSRARARSSGGSEAGAAWRAPEAQAQHGSHPGFKTPAALNDGSMPPRPLVYATRALPGAGFRSLGERAELRIWPGPGSPPHEIVRAQAHDAEGLLCLLTDRVDGALLDACPRLRVVSSCSAGVDHIDLVAAARRGIAVGHTPGVLTETTADLAFALLLAAARRVAEGDRFVRAGRWTEERRWEPELLLGRDVHGAVLGVVGLGAIGQAVARRAG